MEPEFQKRFWWVFPVAFLGLAVVIVLLGTTSFFDEVSGADTGTWVTAGGVVAAGVLLGAWARRGKLPF